MSCSNGFSLNAPRFLCICCSDCYCANCSTKQYAYIKTGDLVAKPVRYCRVCLERIHICETILRAQCAAAEASPCDESLLDPLRRAIENTKQIGGNVLFIVDGEASLKKLEASCQLDQVVLNVNQQRPIRTRESVE